MLWNKGWTSILRTMKGERVSKRSTDAYRDCTLQAPPGDLNLSLNAALHMAAANGHVEVVELLLEKGAVSLAAVVAVPLPARPA